MRFNESVKRLGVVDSVATAFSEIRQVPQFFRGDLDYVYRLGGAVYREILKAAPVVGDRNYVSIDSRVHMLMPGWYPCIGGWHCDDFYRPKEGNGQPALSSIAQSSGLQGRHTSMFIGTTAPTEFISEPFEIPESQISIDHVYASCDQYIAAHPQPTFLAKSGELVQFGSLDFHRCTPATNSSWRLFIRITESDIWHPMNEIRTQANVYIPSASAGW